MRVAFLLIEIPLILGIIYFVLKALQNSSARAKLQEVKVEAEELKVLSELDLEEVKKQRAELARIKKELE